MGSTAEHSSSTNSIEKYKVLSESNQYMANLFFQEK